MIKKSAYALYRLAQLDKLRGFASSRKPTLEKPSWITEQAFANSCNYDYSDEVDEASANLLNSLDKLPTYNKLK